MTATSTAPLVRLYCPSCDAVYRISAEALGPRGRSVRCARCRTVWYAAQEDEVLATDEPFSADAVQADADNVIAVDFPRARDEGGPLAAGMAVPPGAVDRPRRLGRLSPEAPLAAATLIVLTLLALAVIYRVEVVRALPNAARLYALAGVPVNIRGLTIEGVRSVEEIDQGVPVLVVTGTVTSIADMPLEVPKLRLAVNDAAKGELYAWTSGTADQALQPGQSTAFRARLAAPPEAGSSVVVRFVNRRDLVTGAP